VKALALKKRKKQNKAPAVSELRPNSPGASGFSDDQMHKLTLAVLALTVFACALTLRLLFVQEILMQNSCLYGDLNAAPKASFLANPDSDAYISLAKHFYSSFIGDQAGAMALWRSPGYPAALIPFYRFGLAPEGILNAQAILGALIPVLTLFLALILTGSTVLAGLAGLLSMVSPTGIGSCGLIMNDLFMGFLIIAGVYLLYLGTVRVKASWLIISGVLFSAALLVKPLLTLWPVCIIAIHYLLSVAEKKRPSWKALGVAVAIQIMVLGLWCTRNYHYEKVFLPSSIINLSLYDYMRPRVEEWVKTGGLPTNQSVRSNRNEARARFDQQTAGISLAKQLDLMKTKSMEVLLAHPWVTMQVFFQNIKEHAFSGWDYFSRQLPLGPEQGQKLSYAARLESEFREKIILAIAGFFFFLLIAIGVRPTPAKRRAASHALVLILIYGYFSVFSGTVFWGGARIMYPVEFALILLTVMMLQGICTASKNMIDKARFPTPAFFSTGGVLHRYGPWLAALLTLSAGGYGFSLIMEKDSGLYNNLGGALASRGNVKESVYYFEQAVQRDPRNLQLKLNLAITFLNLSHYEKAVPLLRDVLMGRPGDADINYFLGTALAKSGELQEGRKYLQETLRLNPSHENAKKALSQLTYPMMSVP
jgi:tetratricopeptide (TPR) repeat protein